MMDITSILKRLNTSIVNTIILMLFLLAAVSQNGKIFGTSYDDLFSKNKKEIELKAPKESMLYEAGLANINLELLGEGIWWLKTDKGKSKGYVLNSIPFTKGLYGFAGPVPLYVFMNRDSIITSVQLMDNDETPEFIKSAIKEGVISQWYGLHSKSVDKFKPDAITGASITCFAINYGVKRSVSSFAKIESSRPGNYFTFKNILALLVLLSGLVISFWKARPGIWRNIQLLINLLVLGFYCGQFISLKSILAFVQNGVNVFQSIVFVTMLILALIIPMVFRKNAYYCTWVCPYGAAQELAGKLTKKKFRIKPVVRKYLGNLRSLLTMVILFSLWLGISFDLINYEPFSAFLFEHASVAIMIIAISGVALAVFLPMPFCRYACPTGELLKWTQKLN